jgi:ADP-heptose:LPS heptosyltransferase
MLLRAGEVLHLLRAYQGVICARPLDAGNLEFLESLVSASQAFARALQHAPRTGLHDRAEVKRVIELVEQQTSVNAKTTSAEIVARMGNLLGRSGNGGSSRLYLRGPLQPLSADYEAVTVLFGPALGLGDQITFFPFLDAIARHCAGARITILTLYPNLWRRLLPQVKDVSYRRRPLRPFVHLESSCRKCQRELVIVADFESFEMHRKVVRQHRGRDIFEIALGRRAAWFSGGGSAWIRHYDFFSHVDREGNYDIMKRVREQLIPATAGAAAWHPVSSPARCVDRDTVVVLVNPFTSKKSSLDPSDWCRILRRMRAIVAPSLAIRALIYPGVHEWSRGYATAICADLANDRRLTAVLLDAPSGSALTPFDGLPRLVDSLGHVDVCLTLDTFTAHLVPLFSIPTLVITTHENRDFWVPASRSFYFVLERRTERRLDEIGELLAALPPQSRSGAATQLSELPDTSAAARHHLVPLIDRLQRTVAELLAQVEPSFPLRAHGQEWLMVWSRLALALRNEPVDPSLLWPYLARWEESSFCKLIRRRLRAQIDEIPGSGPR